MSAPSCIAMHAGVGTGRRSGHRPRPTTAEDRVEKALVLLVLVLQLIKAILDLQK
ncbi:hypothetical protein [Azospirillum endophyticum]